MTNNSVEVVVVGAGPYGLSVAAHLHERVPYRIFGTTMDTWRHHMPEGMLLRSPGFGSNLNDPNDDFTLAAYWSATGRNAASMRDPIPLETYCDYGQWFVEQAGIAVEDVHVERITRIGRSFLVELATGEQLEAQKVVLAVGLTHFPHVAPELAQLPSHLVTHSSEVLKPSEFAQRQVVVVGAGQSALELAALLHEARAQVRVVARTEDLMWTGDKIDATRSIVERLRAPEGGLCAGWNCIGYEYGSQVFRLLPERWRLKVVRTRFGPMGAWWLRPRLADVNIMLGRSLVDARPGGDGVELEVSSKRGVETLSADHVIVATGYRVDLARLAFLDDAARAQLRMTGPGPKLSRSFESSVDGLYFVGAASAMTFGPVNRFVVGATPSARIVARHCARTVGRQTATGVHA